MSRIDREVSHGIKLIKNFVLQRTPTELLVRDATSNETPAINVNLRDQVAAASYSREDYNTILDILFTRLTDSGRKWKHVYKSLNLLHYLLIHGPEKIVKFLKSNEHLFKALTKFDYVDEGLDHGKAVRDEARKLIVALSDLEKLKKERAEANLQRRPRSKSSNTTRPSSSALPPTPKKYVDVVPTVAQLEYDAPKVIKAPVAEVKKPTMNLLDLDSLMTTTAPAPAPVPIVVPTSSTDDSDFAFIAKRSPRPTSVVVPPPPPVVVVTVPVMAEDVKQRLREYQVLLQRFAGNIDTSKFIEVDKQALRDLVQQEQQWVGEQHNNVQLTKEAIASRQEAFETSAKNIADQGKAKSKFVDQMRLYYQKLQHEKLLSQNDKKLIKDTLDQAVQLVQQVQSITAREIYEQQSKIDAMIRSLVQRAQLLQRFKTRVLSIRKRAVAVMDTSNNTLIDDPLINATAEEKQSLLQSCDKVQTEFFAKAEESQSIYAVYEIEAYRQQFENEISPILEKYSIRTQFENYLQEISERLKQNSLVPATVEDRETIQKAIKENLAWLETKQPDELVTQRFGQVKAVIDPIIARANVGDELNKYLEAAKKRFKNFYLKMTAQEREIVDEALKQGNSWWMSNKHASASEIDLKTKDLQGQIDPVLDAVELREELRDRANDAVHIMRHSKILQGSMSEAEKEAVMKYTNEAVSWIKSNPNASAEELQSQKSQLELKLQSVGTFRWDVGDVKYYGYDFQEHIRWGDLSKRTKEVVYGSFLKAVPKKRAASVMANASSSASTTTSSTL